MNVFCAFRAIRANRVRKGPGAAESSERGRGRGGWRTGRIGWTWWRRPCRRSRALGLVLARGGRRPKCKWGKARTRRRQETVCGSLRRIWERVE